jgi:hypothetical protein
VLNSIDSSITDLKGGFKKDSFNLAVLSARSTIVAGPDTSLFVLQSGDHPLTLMAGSEGGDSAIGYVEFHLTTANLATLRAACNTSKADSVYLMLHYVAANNDTSVFKGTNTVQAYSCGRKFFPHIRNNLSSADSAGPSTITISRIYPDSIFAVPLTSDIVTLLNSAVADTDAYVRHVAWADTLIGNVKGDSARPVRPDTAFSAGPSLFQVVQDTITGIARIDTVLSVIRRDTAHGRDTAIVSCMALQSNGTAVTLVKADTLPFTDSIVQLTSALAGDTAIIAYTAVRSRKVITAFSYDSSWKYIAAVHLYASGGGLVRFSGLSFRIKYRNACSDTVRQTIENTSLAYYYSTSVIEQSALPADSLVASWQADRFVELKVNLQPFWDSILGVGTGKSFRIVQDASVLLNASDPVFERVGTADTTRTIVYGMLDHQITGSRAQSSGTRDSLGGIINAIAVNPSTSQISLPLAKFLQSMYEENQRPATGYLYLFVKSSNHFARVIFGNRNTVKTISCSALFSNPQK